MEETGGGTVGWWKLEWVASVEGKVLRPIRA